MKNKSIRLVLGISLNAIFIVVVIFLIYSVGTKGFAFGAKVFNEKAMDTASTAREVEVVIPEGVTPKELAKILYSKNLIDDATVFRVQVELSDYKKKIIAGTYKLSSSMKPTDMLKTISTPSTDGGTAASTEDSTDAATDD